MTNIDNLTDQQIKGLKGHLSVGSWNKVGQSLFDLGLVCLDPLAESCGLPTSWVLTDDGVALAKELRGIA